MTGKGKGTRCTEGALRAATRSLDVTDASGVDVQFDGGAAESERVDIFVNGAGMAWHRHALDHSLRARAHVLAYDGPSRRADVQCRAGADGVCKRRSIRTAVSRPR